MMEEMDMIDEEENPPSPTSPFWLKSTNKRRRFRLLPTTTTTPVFFSTGVFVAILTISACLLLLSAVPSFISYTQQVIRPSSVKKGWDSVNLLLVAFAIVCAFLGKKDAQDSPRNNINNNIAAAAAGAGAGDVDVDRLAQIQFQFHRRQGFGETRSGSFRDSRRWYGDYYESVDRGDGRSNGSEVTRLRRTSTSYPDLSQVYYDQGMRSYAYDDSYVRYYNYAAAAAGSVADPLRSPDRGGGGGDDEVKDIQIDSLRNHHPIHPQSEMTPEFPPQQQQPNLIPQPQPPLPPSPAAVPRSSGSAQAVRVIKVVPMQEEVNDEHRGRRDPSVGRRRQSEQQPRKVPVPAPVRVRPRAVTPPPPARTPSPPSPRQSEHRPISSGYETDHQGKSRKKSTKKRTGSSATTSTPKKDIFTTIYQQSKRKIKPKRKSHENLDDFFQSSPSNYNTPPLFPPPPPSPPPPPPPLPPPRQQSVLQTVFSTKKGKGITTSKDKSHILDSAAPARTSHSHRSIQQNPSTYYPSTKSETSKTRTASSSTTSFDNTIIMTGNESPLIPIPPPPPPPFKMKPWKFVLKGDYVKIVDNSNDSPKSYDSESPSISATSTPAKGNDYNSSSLMFCPSPDVNMKADDFIARFRSTLKLEKMDSIHHHGLSPLSGGGGGGSDSGPSLLRT